jgi:hypothetical protein
MTSTQIFIIVSVIVLAVSGLLILIVKGIRDGKRLSPFAMLAFGSVLAGMVFRDIRLIGYGLMGIGLMIASFDLWRTSRKS